MNAMDTIDQLSRHTILAVAARARDAQLSPVLIDVLVDPSQPEVARLRAFGKLTAALGNVAHRQAPRPKLRPAA